MGNLVLVRHGETKWSAAGRHTSRTDVDLTPRGERQAAALGRRLHGLRFGQVWCSPRQRATRTAELAGLAVIGYDDDLVEWDYGDYEGLTSAQIRAGRPEWSLWTDGCPGGEAPDQLRHRVDRLLAKRCGGDGGGAAGDTVFVAHGHVLRVVAARWLGLGVEGGALLALDPAGISELGHEHGRSVVRRWNLAA